MRKCLVQNFLIFCVRGGVVNCQQGSDQDKGGSRITIHDTANNSKRIFSIRCCGIFLRVAGLSKLTMCTTTLVCSLSIYLCTSRLYVSAVFCSCLCYMDIMIVPQLNEIACNDGGSKRCYVIKKHLLLRSQNLITDC